MLVKVLLALPAFLDAVASAVSKGIAQAQGAWSLVLLAVFALAVAFATIAVLEAAAAGLRWFPGAK